MSRLFTFQRKKLPSHLFRRVASLLRGSPVSGSLSEEPLRAKPRRFNNFKRIEHPKTAATCRSMVAISGCNASAKPSVFVFKLVTVRDAKNLAFY
jgi:hypothetical protein